MNHAATSQPLDALWQAPAIVWSILAGLCLALVLTFSPGVEDNRLVVFGLASFLIQWVILLTLGSLYALRRPIGRLSPYRVALLALLMMLGWTWIVTGTARGLVGPALLGSGSDWLGPMARVTGIALAVGTLGLAAFHNHWRARQAAVRAKQAELEALQARTHPHFLFNSLNTALALLHQRPDEAERVLLDLSDLFRSALAGPRFIPLAEELDLARRYLEIESLRLGARLNVRWDLPSPLPEVDVPALSIQPLVENAVRHGIEPRREGGRIDVMLTHAGNHLRITVHNDLPTGVAVGTGKGHGVGQPSVASRIEAMTGGQGSLTTLIEDGRYAATITAPLRPPSTPQVTTS
ncbi:sensor histidine kinase [Luteimonas sp. A478]